ncbi:tRNA-5-carboxymethylaminomethyl-2-thiouridine(34)synthesis protein MnmE [hydrothermal vent metagenome]|uniref:tRNA-5-carboxymethylaminomethyl-2-thiouridine(34) synthesis protein MnmE n=1 Tax=hydrothermal vent metagenome TaxID=652676 RepID=A0A3B0Z666_9ZZZZ
MLNENETIAAIATAPGRGGVGIVRISGKKAGVIADQILGKRPALRHAEYLNFSDANGDVIDAGIALLFVAPHSFTGEDVLELQGHGGSVVLDMLLQRVIELGARLAKPGEFSERAYLNDKLDLAQAEAIADLIDCTSQQAARSALRSLQGEFSRQVNALLQQLIEVRVYVESALDFPEEEIDFLSDGKVLQMINNVINTHHNIMQSAQQGALLRDGMSVVIVGRPNVGKSSLLNALASREAAIVTDIAGTTRDVLREQITIDGLPLHIIDTAGLRDSDDVVEKLGIERAYQEIEKADAILLLLDDSRNAENERSEMLAILPEGCDYSVLYNKIDLSERKASSTVVNGISQIALSAKGGEGIDLLRDHLKQKMGYNSTAEGVFMARRRHIDALQRAKENLLTGKEQLEHNHSGELLAEELRQAQQALGEITGEFSSDDLLGEIFSSFCIGK